jgi:hypothetical protein
MSIITLFDHMVQESNLFFEKEQDNTYKVVPKAFPFPIGSEEVSWAVIGVFNKHSNGCGTAEEWTEQEFAIIMLGLIAEYIGVDKTISEARWRQLCLILLSYFEKDIVVTSVFIKRQKNVILSWIKENDK